MKVSIAHLILLCSMTGGACNLLGEESDLPGTYKDLFEEVLKIGDDPDLSAQELQQIKMLNNAGEKAFPDLLDLYQESTDPYKKAFIIDFVDDQKVKSQKNSKSIFLDPIRAELKKLILDGQIDNHDYRSLMGQAVLFLGNEGNKKDINLIKKIEESDIGIVKLFSKKSIEKLAGTTKKR